MLRHPAGLPGGQRPALALRQRRGQLQAQGILLDLLFQHDMVQVIVVPADAPFLPPGHAVDLFPQGLVVSVIKIDTVDNIAPIRTCVAVRFHHRSQPLPQGKIRSHVNGVLQLVAIGLAHRQRSFLYRMAVFSRAFLKSS